MTDLFRTLSILSVPQTSGNWGVNDSEIHYFLWIPVLDDDNSSGIVSCTLLTCPFGKVTGKVDCSVVNFGDI